VDGLHRERTDTDARRALGCSDVPPETIPRSGAAHLLVPDDHLHVRNLDSVLPELTAMNREARPLDKEASTDRAVEEHKFVRKIVSLIIVAGAILITFYVWGIIERHPRTDDATARANVVGIAPRVAGQILKLNVQDNQAVKEGDVLFEIDPEDYRLVLEKAKAELAALDRQIAQADMKPELN
jgi:Biotin-lipoyl like